DVQHEMAKGHLLFGGLVVEFVSGHRFDCGHQVLLLVRQDFLGHRGDWILILSENCRRYQDQKKTAGVFHGVFHSVLPQLSRSYLVAVSFYSALTGEANGGGRARSYWLIPLPAICHVSGAAPLRGTPGHREVSDVADTRVPRGANFHGFLNGRRRSVRSAD